MAHLLNRAARYLSIPSPYTFYIGNRFIQRSCSFQRTVAAICTNSTLNLQLSCKTDDYHQKRQLFPGINSRLKRWYSSTSDHAKKFNFIADAVEIASPAVVYVDVKIQQQQGGLFGMGGVAQGAGSGFIVTDYGIILTNAHVVNNSTSVAVKLASSDVCTK